MKWPLTQCMPGDEHPARLFGAVCRRCSAGRLDAARHAFESAVALETPRFLDI